MSTGHLKLETKGNADLYKALGAGDTPALYAKPVQLDTSHTVAYGGGVSVNGKTVYIDHQLYRDVMDGRCYVRGMTPRQIIKAFVEHEHSEKSIDDGDNSIDVYEAAHEFATTKEHELVRQLGIDPQRYEDCVAPALKRAMERPQTKPPHDLWCGPYIDHADKRDKEILRQYRAKGVEDAHKISKFETHYGFGANQCKDCVMFQRGSIGSGPLQKCDLVSGLVRDTRSCDRFEARKGE